MTSPLNFTQALIAAYRENPCQVLPNALWKSLSWVDQFQTEFKEEGGLVTQLRAWNSQQLMLYWNRDRGKSCPFSLDDLNRMDFILLHKDFEFLMDLTTFRHCQSYFRLRHPLQVFPKPNLPEGFSFSLADPITEAVEIAKLINACYVNSHLTPEVVQGWVDHPVFDANLWVWVIDEQHNTLAGLGIAELDTIIAEGSLEWIQILPAYRGKGLGKQIVYELLLRLSENVEITTVSGQVDNRTHPEMLYRSCGFEGEDHWWVLRR